MATPLTENERRLISALDGTEQLLLEAVGEPAKCSDIAFQQRADDRVTENATLIVELRR